MTDTKIRVIYPWEVFDAKTKKIYLRIQAGSVLRLMQESGKPVEEVARELGIRRKQLYK